MTVRPVPPVVLNIDKLKLYLQNPHYVCILLTLLRPEDDLDAMIRAISGFGNRK